jgi:hypothetical protein
VYAGKGKSPPESSSDAKNAQSANIKTKTWPHSTPLPAMPTQACMRAKSVPQAKLLSPSKKVAKIALPAHIKRWIPQISFFRVKRVPKDSLFKQKI